MRSFLPVAELYFVVGSAHSAFEHMRSLTTLTRVLGLQHIRECLFIVIALSNMMSNKNELTEERSSCYTAIDRSGRRENKACFTGAYEQTVNTTKETSRGG